MNWISEIVLTYSEPQSKVPFDPQHHHSDTDSHENHPFRRKKMGRQKNHYRENKENNAKKDK
jgi:hypothetical protein